MTGISRWHRYGTDAVLVEVADPALRWDLTSPLANETVAGASTVLFRFDPSQHAPDDVVASIVVTGTRRVVAREHVIRVRYDGADLGEIARHRGIPVAEVISRHSRVVYRAEFCGFAPGFAYLSGLDAAIATPRRPTPRSRVPRGSVAIAGPYCAVYPTESPGGWQLLGTTETALFDVESQSPALIRPGDLVRFEAPP